MQKRKRIFPTFLIFFLISIFLFVLSRTGALNGLAGIFETITVPIQKSVSNLTHLRNEDSEVSRLKEENLALSKRLVDQKIQDREIKALRDQFQVASINPRNLKPASVIGYFPDKIVIDKGLSDQVKTGSTVIYKDNMVGIVTKTSAKQAVIELITSSNTSFTVKTLNSNVFGILKSQENGLVLTNVVLSDKIEKDDLILTKGRSGEDNSLIIPDLIVGKIVSVNKKPSDLFQSAEVESLVDFSRLATVFIMTGN